MPDRIQTAVVLAAGSGTRFWPYNVVRNKVAFPICNVPVVRRLVIDLVQLGVARIAVVVGQGEASVRAALRGVPGQITYVRQPRPEGTAAAAWLGASTLDEDALSNGLLVVHGDLATDPNNLAALVDRFAGQRPLAAALIQPFGDENPRDWVVAHVDGEKLRGVEGHARGGRYRLCGAYAFAYRALDVLRDNPGVMCRVPVGGMPPVESEIAQSLQMLVDENDAAVLAVEVPGYHVDLDKPWHILEANHRVMYAMSAALNESVIPASAQVHDGAEIGGRLVLGENAVIGNRAVIQGDLWLGAGARVENGAIITGAAVVGAKTVLRDYCQIGGHSTLGTRGVYGHGAEYSGVALDTVYCYHYCEIWGVTGSAVDFGAATVCGNLRFDDGETMFRIKGRAEVPTSASNAAYLGDYCRTGVNTILMPGRRVGVYSCVGPGVVLYEDVPDRTMVLVKQELESRHWGPERYGW
jgi:bifunctional UDP-N-acetylglucosamine pyrophosphorylase/glucosamine-1-phosphate N-acetyltransferase